MRPLVRDSHSYTARVPGILNPSWMQSLLHLHESMQAGRRKKNSSNQLGHKISTKTKTQAHPSSLVWFPFTPREGSQKKRSHLIIQLPVEAGNLLVVFLFLLCRDAGHDRRDVVNDRGVITGLQVLLVLRADLLILGHGFSCGHTNHGQGEGAGSPKPRTAQAGAVQLLRGSQQSQGGPRTAPRAGTGQAVAMDKGERYKSGGKDGQAAPQLDTQNADRLTSWLHLHSSPLQTGSAPRINTSVNKEDEKSDFQPTGNQTSLPTRFPTTLSTPPHNEALKHQEDKQAYAQQTGCYPYVFSCKLLFSKEYSLRQRSCAPITRLLQLSGEGQQAAGARNWIGIH